MSMFNFFKKKNDPIREHLGGFQDGFTTEQKVAVWGALVMLAKSKGQMHRKEVDFIDQTSSILGLDYDEVLFAKISRGGVNELISILNTLDRSQKEWFVITMRTMSFVDGKINEGQIEFALGLAEKIGISEAEVIEIIDKTEQLNKLFGFS